MNTRWLFTAALAALLLGLQWRLWVGDGGVAGTVRLQREMAALTDENEQLRARNAALDAEVRDLGSGLVAIEARARRTLGMIKDGETFYLVVHR